MNIPGFDESPALKAMRRQFKLVEDARRSFDHAPALKAMQEALTNSARLEGVSLAAEAMQRQFKLVEDARRSFDHAPALKAMQEALPTLRTSRLFEGLGPGKDEVHDPVLELSAMGWEDASNGTADPTAEMLEVLETLVELETWIGLAALLGRLREAGLDSMDAGWFAVTRQIDERLGWLVVTASPDGVCWRCGVPALTRFGVACSGCVVLVGEMMLEMWLLVEGL